MIANKMDAKYVIHLDADGQYKPEEIEQILSPLVDGESDLVSGSRKLGYYYLPVFTLTIVLTSFTMMPYATIVTVAVPNVMGAFGIGQDKAQLLATGFYISMTVSQLICAWLILTIGHYYTFIISIILFLFACFIGAFSNDYAFIIVSRLIQGFSAGILMSQTMVAVVQAYPINRRGYALSMFTIGGVLAIGIGPVLGGIIVRLAIPPRLRTPRHPYNLPTKASSTNATKGAP